VEETGEGAEVVAKLEKPARVGRKGGGGGWAMTVACYSEIYNAKIASFLESQGGSWPTR
jgi:hypothetical protein